MKRKLNNGENGDRNLVYYFSTLTNELGERMERDFVVPLEQVKGEELVLATTMLENTDDGSLTLSH